MRKDTGNNGFYCNLIEWNDTHFSAKKKGNSSEDEEVEWERKQALRENGERTSNYHRVGGRSWVLESRRWYEGTVQQLPAASVVGGRTVARWRERRTRGRGTVNDGGDADELSAEWTSGMRGWGGQAWWQQSPWVGDMRFSWVISLMRHSDLPSLPPSLFRSLCHPFPPLPFLLSSSLSFSHPLSKSPSRSMSLQVEPEGNRSLSTELYIYTRTSLCSPELTGPWKNLGRMLLTSNYSFYLMILTCNFLCTFDAVDTD